MTLISQLHQTIDIRKWFLMSEYPSHAYDLAEVARQFIKDRLEREAQKEEWIKRANRVIAKIESKGDHANPYDLSEVAEILGSPQPEDFSR